MRKFSVISLRELEGFSRFKRKAIDIAVVVLLARQPIFPFPAPLIVPRIRGTCAMNSADLGIPGKGDSFYNLFRRPFDILALNKDFHRRRSHSLVVSTKSHPILFLDGIDTNILGAGV